MRNMTMMTLLASIVVLTMRCGGNESLSDLSGRMETTSVAVNNLFYIVQPDVFLDSVTVHTDSIKWIYEFPSIGPSSVSVIISGKSQVDLEVETYTNGVTSIVPLVSHTAETIADTIPFIDTVPIAASPLPGLILTQSSLLFVKRDTTILGAIPIFNPQAFTADTNSPHPTAIDSQKLEPAKRRGLSIVGN